MQQDTLLPIRSLKFIARLAASMALVAAVTSVCRMLSVNATTAGFAYLLIALGVATAWGLTEAIVTSVAGMLSLNFYFLPPVGQFTIADPQNWVALFAFLATSLVASHLSDREKKQSIEARANQREMEQLYALSRSILLSDTLRAVGAQTARSIADVFDCRSVALYDSKTLEVFRGGPEDMPDIEGKLKQVVFQGAPLMDPAKHLLVAPIILGGREIGSLAAKGLTLSDGGLQALLNLVAIALERVRTEEAARRAEAARQSGEFKSTLLDAIAHEFKTPLTSVKAASTSILADSAALTPQTRELATIIDEETDRMSLLVTEAVRMSQVEAGKIHLDRKPVAVDELLKGVVDHFSTRLEGRSVIVNPSEGPLHVEIDEELVSLALRQIIDNALKYSPAGTPISISTGASQRHVLIRIRDQGPGIPERDRERIFEKFHRLQSGKDRVPGTGLGLYIAREIIRTHGGELWVEPLETAGSEFCVTLPVHGESVNHAVPGGEA